MAENMKELLVNFPHAGKVEWISRRREREVMPEVVESAELDPKTGLVGDHYKGTNGNRHLTLIEEASIRAVATYLRRDEIDPGLLRRNVVVSGINFGALEGKKLRIGSAVIEVTGECHPCSRMEKNLGLGGYNAMRGHGGLTTRVLEAGSFAIGDPVVVIEE